MIEILELPDKNYRISENIRQLLGPSDKAVFKALLEDEDKPQKERAPSGVSRKPLFAEIVGPSTVIVGKRAIYRAEFDGDLEFEWHYTQPVKLTDRNVFVELGYPGQTETLTLRVKGPDGQTFTTSKMITAIAPPSAPRPPDAKSPKDAGTLSTEKQTIKGPYPDETKITEPKETEQKLQGWQSPGQL